MHFSVKSFLHKSLEKYFLYLLMIKYSFRLVYFEAKVLKTDRNTKTQKNFIN